jgi:hypothetical protein
MRRGGDGLGPDVYLRCTCRVPRIDMRPASRPMGPPSASGSRRSDAASAVLAPHRVPRVGDGPGAPHHDGRHDQQADQQPDRRVGIPWPVQRKHVVRDHQHRRDQHAAQHRPGNQSSALLRRQVLGRSPVMAPPRTLGWSSGLALVNGCQRRRFGGALLEQAGQQHDEDGDPDVGEGEQHPASLIGEVGRVGQVISCVVDELPKRCLRRRPGVNSFVVAFLD